MSATVVVTGAAGFIGSHLAAALLQEGRRVIGIDNFDPFYDRRAKIANLARIHRTGLPPGSRPGESAAAVRIDSAPDFELVEADICERQRMAAIFAEHKPAALFHVAALAGVRPSIADPARYASVNVDGLVSMLDAARNCGCRNIVFASSSSVYGNNRKVPFAETDPVDEPISPYAATKRGGELICQTYAHLFGLRIAALRFFTVYGPAQRPDLAIASFMRLIAASEEVPMFGDGSTSRDYTYIDDIIQGVLAAEKVVSDEQSAVCESGRVGPAGFFRIWNLGGAHPITLSEMIDTIARVVGKPAHIQRLPMQPGDVERTWADVARSRAELDFHPSTDFQDGVRRQWEWLKTERMSDHLSISSR